MTETILNSLYYQTLFIRNENLESHLQTKEEILSFVSGILFLIKKTSFFSIDYRRAIRLRFILLRLIKQNKDSFYRDEDLFKKITELLDYCDSIESSKDLFRNLKDDRDYHYSLSEAKKRNLTFFALPAPEEIASFFAMEYAIISSLVKGDLFNFSYPLSTLLSVFSLLITTYQEILYENPRVYFFIVTYLNILLEKRNLESFFHKKRIRIILKEYQQIQKDFSEENFSYHFKRNK